MNAKQLVEQAQVEIANMLANLEFATGQLVRSISVQSLDSSRIHDAVPQWQRHVVIDLDPIPGSHWS